MNYVISYSCGKDSALSLLRMQEAGHVAVGLLVMYNLHQERSYFHGVDHDLLKEIADALAIPLILCASKGEDYHLVFESGLNKAKKMGAEACVFGDIDIEDHRRWGEQRCQLADIHAVFPLWQENREALVLEGIQKGLCSIIKCIHNEELPTSMLGKKLDVAVIEDMKEHHIDVCGENGEYHSLCVAGPIFHRDVDYQLFDILHFDKVSVIDIRKREKNV